jgi:hypothetical protein
MIAWNNRKKKSKVDGSKNILILFYCYFGILFWVSSVFILISVNYNKKTVHFVGSEILADRTTVI